MADPIGIASGMLALSTFAFQSSIALYQTIQSFKAHSTRVRDVQQELNALSEVLGSLNEQVGATADDKLSVLSLPLLRCGKACKEFEQELLKCSSHSGGGRTSFRDWARLRYMGDNIDGFKQQLAGYKSTIIIALADANLHKSAVTEKSLKSYTDLVETATEDLEAHLQSIDDKLEAVLGLTTKGSGSDTAEIRLIKEERLSTQKCLQICARLSEHITEIQLESKGSYSSSEYTSTDSVPQKLTFAGLQECKDSLAATTVKLEAHMKDIIDRLVAKSNTATTSKEDLVDLTRLRDEWDTARECRDICSRANTNLKENVSAIDNDASGDAVQFLVSTTNKTISGRNRGHGWRIRQFGGHMSDTSLQKISGDYAHGAVQVQNAPNESPILRGNATSVSDDEEEEEEEEEDAGAGAEFGERHGPGVKLLSVNITGKPKS